jgi:transposase-like protein
MPYSKKFEETIYSKEWLQRMYAEADNTASDIARLIGCDNSAVLRQLRKHGFQVKGQTEVIQLMWRRGVLHGSRVPRPRKKFLATINNKEWMVRKYEVEGLNYSEIARIVGATPQSVYQAILRLGLAPRGISEAKLTRPCFARRKDPAILSEVALRARARRSVKHGPCVICGAFGQDVGHKDHDIRNNEPDNLERLCRQCHSLQHKIESDILFKIANEKLGVKWRDLYELARQRIFQVKNQGGTR